MALVRRFSARATGKAPLEPPGRTPGFDDGQLSKASGRVPTLLKRGSTLGRGLFMILRTFLVWCLVVQAVLPAHALANASSPTPSTLCSEALSASSPLSAKDARVARATLEVEAALNESILAIQGLTEQLVLARECGDVAQCSVLRLKLAANEIRGLVVSTLVGYRSETLGVLNSLFKKWVFGIGEASTSQAARKTFLEGLASFFGIAWGEFKQNASAFKSEQIRKDPVVFFDLAKRLLVVLSIQGVMMGVTAWQQLDNPSYQIPWEIFPNTFVMMWLQSEISARNTQRNLASGAAETADSAETTPSAPAANRFELYRSIPSAIAGKEGLLVETAKRLFGAATLMPFEGLMIFGMKTVTRALVTGGESLADANVWYENGLGAMAFVSLFGLYLAVSDSVAAKIAELRVLPEIQKMNAAEFNRKWAALAEQHSIPFEGRDAWRGWMVKQLTQVFVPNAPAPTDDNSGARAAGWRGLLGHLFSRSVWEKFQQHLADRRRFSEFWNLPEVATLRSSPEARRAWRSQFIEFFAYRVPKTLFDSYLAVLLMGSKGSTEAKPVPQGP